MEELSNGQVAKLHDLAYGSELEDLVFDDPWLADMT